MVYVDETVPGRHLLQRHNILQPPLHRKLYDVTATVGRLRERVEHHLLQGPE